MNATERMDILRYILWLAIAISLGQSAAIAKAPSVDQDQYASTRQSQAQSGAIEKITSALSSTDPSRIPSAQWLLFVTQIVTLILLLKTAAANQKSADATAATVHEMQVSRERASAPNIVTYLLSPDASLIEIIVENFGEGTARDLTIKIDPPLQSATFENPGRFFETPKWLAPRSRLTFALDVWQSYFAAKLPRQYIFVLDYTDASNGNKFTGEFVLSLDSFLYLPSLRKKGLPELVGLVEKLVESQKQQSQALARGIDLIESGFPYSRESSSLEESMATIRGVNDLICSKDDYSEVHLPWKLLFRGLRSAMLSAIVYLDMNQDLMPSLRAALLDALLQLHHYKAWNSMMETEESEQLAASIEALLRLFYPDYSTTKDQASDKE